MNYEESSDLSTVTVTLVIPGLSVKKKFFGGAELNPAESEVDVKLRDT